jgi:DNA-binding NtrC family response regulator
VRVVVSSHDRRFLRLMGFLISRLGHEVAVVRRDEDVSEVAASLGADVVVLDGSDSLAEMTAAVAAVERLLPDAKVIVVADAAAAAGNHQFHVVPKWSPFDHLGLEIEAASAAAGRSVTAHRR